MKSAVEMVLNGWLYGVPLVLLVWAALRLLHSAPARLRYVLVIAAFAVAITVPMMVVFRQPAVRGLATMVEAQGRSADVDPLQFVDAMATPLTSLWLIGAVVLLIRELAGHLRLRRARRLWNEAPAELRRLLDWPERTPLAVAPDASPLTTGLARPLVVLPDDLVAAFSLPVARRIALHELSHCRWRDPLVYAAMRVAASLFWLSPLWLLLRWARREREVAADEVALRTVTGDEESYVAALVRLSRLALAHRAAASPMAASDLEFRAGRILSVTRRSSIVLSMAALASAAALASVVEPVRLPREVVVRAATIPVAVAPPRPLVVAPPVVVETPARSEPSHVVPAREIEVVEPEAEKTETQADDPGDIHVDVHVAMDDHVDVNRHVDVAEHVSEHVAAEAVNDSIRDSVQEEVLNQPASEGRDERDVIRIVSVVRIPDSRRQSRWRSFVNAVRGGARSP